MSNRVNICYADPDTGRCDFCGTWATINDRGDILTCASRRRSDSDLLGDSPVEELVDLMDNMND